MDTRVTIAGVVVGTVALASGALIFLNDRGEPNIARGSQEQVLSSEESLFAEVDPNTGEVLRVIVISADLVNSGRWGDPKNFIRTYAEPERGRKNPAAIGYTYREDLDAFVSPKPYDSWELDDVTAQWEAPVEMPTDNKPYEWDERGAKWLEMEYEALD